MKKKLTLPLFQKEEKKAIRRATSPPITDLANIPDRNVNKVVYGSFEMDAWYFSPYPYNFGAMIDRLYICEYCLRYMYKETQLAHHKVCLKTFYFFQKKPPYSHMIFRDYVKREDHQEESSMQMVKSKYTKLMDTNTK